VIYAKRFHSEVKRSTLKLLGTKYHVHYGDLILRALECIVTISFGVYLIV